MRPVPTKWEASRKISFPSYNQIHVVENLSFKMICNMPELLPYLGSKTYISWEIPLFSIDLMKVQWAFYSLVNCCSLCENRSHMILDGISVVTCNHVHSFQVQYWVYTNQVQVQTQTKFKSKPRPSPQIQVESSISIFVLAPFYLLNLTKIKNGQNISFRGLHLLGSR